MENNPGFHPLPTPTGAKRLSTSEVLSGPIVPKIDLLRSMHDKDFEDTVYEWATGNLLGTYQEVKLFGGAGDKGRDVVGFYSNGDIDIYQCKHYDTVIAPTTLYPELAKLCYFTHTNAYKVPKKYCIISPNGCGPAVLDLIKNPIKINALLCENWKAYGEKIATPNVKLDDALKKHIEEFDFSIICDKDPLQFIAEHEKTVYHPRRFGGGLRVYRTQIPKPGLKILANELIYTRQLFKVYSENLGQNITNIDELEKLDTKLSSNFNNQRNSFYSAESLEKFSRENYPDSDPHPFDELKGDAYTIIDNCLLLNRNDKGLDKLLKSIQQMQNGDFSSNPLSLNNEMKPLDRQGLCHHLVNEEKIKWIDDAE